MDREAERWNWPLKHNEKTNKKTHTFVWRGDNEHGEGGVGGFSSSSKPEGGPEEGSEDGEKGKM